MEERWRLQAERSIEKKLARGGEEQVCAANHLSNLHCGIIEDHRELVAGNAIVPPDDEIAKVASRDETLLAERAVPKRDYFAIRNAKAPIRIRRRVTRAVLPAGARIQRFFVALMRRLQGAQNVFARAGAGKESAALAKLVESFSIEIQTLALRIRSERTADVGSFLPR